MTDNNHDLQRIRRWLKYRVQRINKTIHRKLDPRKDPWAIFLAKLSGLTAPPKARQAYQQFMREDYATKVASIVKERWDALEAAGSSVQTRKDPKADFRALVARKIFNGLSTEEQEGYAKRAKEEALAARQEYNEALKAPPSQSPAARQRYVLVRLYVCETVLMAQKDVLMRWASF